MKFKGRYQITGDVGKAGSNSPCEQGTGNESERFTSKCRIRRPTPGIDGANLGIGPGSSRFQEGDSEIFHGNIVLNKGDFDTNGIASRGNSINNGIATGGNFATNGTTCGGNSGTNGTIADGNIVSIGIKSGDNSRMNGTTSSGTNVLTSTKDDTSSKLSDGHFKINDISHGNKWVYADFKNSSAKLNTVSFRETVKCDPGTNDIDVISGVNDVSSYGFNASAIGHGDNISCNSTTTDDFGNFENQVVPTKIHCGTNENALSLLRNRNPSLELISNNLTVRKDRGNLETSIGDVSEATYCNSEDYENISEASTVPANSDYRYQCSMDKNITCTNFEVIGNCRESEQSEIIKDSVGIGEKRIASNRGVNERSKNIESWELRRGGVSSFKSVDNSEEYQYKPRIVSSIFNRKSYAPPPPPQSEGIPLSSNKKLDSLENLKSTLSIGRNSDFSASLNLSKVVIPPRPPPLPRHLCASKVPQTSATKIYSKIEDEFHKKDISAEPSDLCSGAQANAKIRQVRKTNFETTKEMNSLLKVPVSQNCNQINGNGISSTAKFSDNTKMRPDEAKSTVTSYKPRVTSIEGYQNMLQKLRSVKNLETLNQPHVVKRFGAQTKNYDRNDDTSDNMKRHLDGSISNSCAKLASKDISCSNFPLVGDISSDTKVFPRTNLYASPKTNFDTPSKKNLEVSPQTDIKVSHKKNVEAFPRKNFQVSLKNKFEVDSNTLIKKKGTNHFYGPVSLLSKNEHFFKTDVKETDKGITYSINFVQSDPTLKQNEFKDLLKNDGQGLNTTDSAVLKVSQKWNASNSEREQLKNKPNYSNETKILRDSVLEEHGSASLADPIRQCSSVSIDNHTSSVDTTRHSSKVNIDNHTSSVDTTRHSSKVNIDNHTSSVDTTRHSSKVNIDNHTSSVDTTRHSSKVNIDNHTSSVDTTRHSSKVNIDNHTSSVDTTRHSSKVKIGNHSRQGLTVNINDIELPLDIVTYSNKMNSEGNFKQHNSNDVILTTNHEDKYFTLVNKDALLLTIDDYALKTQHSHLTNSRDRSPDQTEGVEEISSLYTEANRETEVYDTVLMDTKEAPETGYGGSDFGEYNRISDTDDANRGIRDTEKAECLGNACDNKSATDDRDTKRYATELGGTLQQVSKWEMETGTNRRCVDYEDRPRRLRLDEEDVMIVHKTWHVAGSQQRQQQQQQQQHQVPQYEQQKHRQQQQYQQQQQEEPQQQQQQLQQLKQYQQQEHNYRNQHRLNHHNTDDEQINTKAACVNTIHRSPTIIEVIPPKSIVSCAVNKRGTGNSTVVVANDIISNNGTNSINSSSNRSKINTLLHNVNGPVSNSDDTVDGGSGICDDGNGNVDGGGININNSHDDGVASTKNSSSSNKRSNDTSSSSIRNNSINNSSCNNSNNRSNNSCNSNSSSNRRSNNNNTNASKSNNNSNNSSSNNSNTNSNNTKINNNSNYSISNNNSNNNSSSDNSNNNSSSDSSSSNNNSSTNNNSTNGNEKTPNSKINRNRIGSNSSTNTTITTVTTINNRDSNSSNNSKNNSHGKGGSKCNKTNNSNNSKNNRSKGSGGGGEGGSLSGRAGGDFTPYGYVSRPGSTPASYSLWGGSSTQSTASTTSTQRYRRRFSRSLCRVVMCCAVFLIVMAVVGIVGIAVYLGVITHEADGSEFKEHYTGSLLVRGGDAWLPALAHQSSPAYRAKAAKYQGMLEAVYGHSVLSSALDRATVVSFSPPQSSPPPHGGHPRRGGESGLHFTFRVTLDRRKIPSHVSSVEAAVKETLVQELISLTPVAFREADIDIDSLTITREPSLPSILTPPFTTPAPLHHPRLQQLFERGGERKDLRVAAGDDGGEEDGDDDGDGGGYKFIQAPGGAIIRVKARPAGTGVLSPILVPKNKNLEPLTTTISSAATTTTTITTTKEPMSTVKNLKYLRGSWRPVVPNLKDAVAAQIRPEYVLPEDVLPGDIYHTDVHDYSVPQEVQKMLEAIREQSDGTLKSEDNFPKKAEAGVVGYSDSIRYKVKKWIQDQNRREDLRFEPNSNRRNGFSRPGVPDLMLNSMGHFENPGFDRRSQRPYPSYVNEQTGPAGIRVVPTRGQNGGYLYHYDDESNPDPDYTGNNYEYAFPSLEEDNFENLHHINRHEVVDELNPVFERDQNVAQSSDHHHHHIVTTLSSRLHHEKLTTASSDLPETMVASLPISDTTIGAPPFLLPDYPAHRYITGRTPSRQQPRKSVTMRTRPILDTFVTRRPNRRNEVPPGLNLSGFVDGYLEHKEDLQSDEVLAERIRDSTMSEFDRAHIRTTASTTPEPVVSTAPASTTTTIAPLTTTITTEPSTTTTTTTTPSITSTTTSSATTTSETTTTATTTPATTVTSTSTAATTTSSKTTSSTTTAEVPITEKAAATTDKTPTREEIENLLLELLVLSSSPGQLGQAFLSSFNDGEVVQKDRNIYTNKDREPSRYYERPPPEKLPHEEILSPESTSSFNVGPSYSHAASSYRPDQIHYPDTVDDYYILGVGNTNDYYRPEDDLDSEYYDDKYPDDGIRQFSLENPGDNSDIDQGPIERADVIGTSDYNVAIPPIISRDSNSSNTEIHQENRHQALLREQQRKYEELLRQYLAQQELLQKQMKEQEPLKAMSQIGRYNKTQVGVQKVDDQADELILHKETAHEMKTSLSPENRLVTFHNLNSYNEGKLVTFHDIIPNHEGILTFKEPDGFHNPYKNDPKTNTPMVRFENNEEIARREMMFINNKETNPLKLFVNKQEMDRSRDAVIAVQEKLKSISPPPASVLEETRKRDFEADLPNSTLSESLSILSEVGINTPEQLLDALESELLAIRSGSVDVESKASIQSDRGEGPNLDKSGFYEFTYGNSGSVNVKPIKSDDQIASYFGGQKNEDLIASYFDAENGYVASTMAPELEFDRDGRPKLTQSDDSSNVFKSQIANSQKRLDNTDVPLVDSVTKLENFQNLVNIKNVQSLPNKPGALDEFIKTQPDFGPHFQVVAFQDPDDPGRLIAFQTIIRPPHLDPEVSENQVASENRIGLLEDSETGFYNGFIRNGDVRDKSKSGSLSYASFVPPDDSTTKSPVKVESTLPVSSNSFGADSFEIMTKEQLLQLRLRQHQYQQQVLEQRRKQLLQNQALIDRASLLLSNQTQQRENVFLPGNIFSKVTPITLGSAQRIAFPDMYPVPPPPPPPSQFSMPPLLELGPPKKLTIWDFLTTQKPLLLDTEVVTSISSDIEYKHKGTTKKERLVPVYVRKTTSTPSPDHTDPYFGFLTVPVISRDHIDFVTVNKSRAGYPKVVIVNTNPTSKGSLATTPMTPVLMGNQNEGRAGGGGSFSGFSLSTEHLDKLFRTLIGVGDSVSDLTTDPIAPHAETVTRFPQLTTGTTSLLTVGIDQEKEEASATVTNSNIAHEVVFSDNLDAVDEESVLNSLERNLPSEILAVNFSSSSSTAMGHPTADTIGETKSIFEVVKDLSERYLAQPEMLEQLQNYHRNKSDERRRKSLETTVLSDQQYFDSRISHGLETTGDYAINSPKFSATELKQTNFSSAADGISVDNSKEGSYGIKSNHNQIDQSDNDYLLSCDGGECNNKTNYELESELLPNHDENLIVNLEFLATLINNDYPNLNYSENKIIDSGYSGSQDEPTNLFLENIQRNPYPYSDASKTTYSNSQSFGQDAFINISSVILDQTDIPSIPKYRKTTPSAANKNLGSYSNKESTTNETGLSNHAEFQDLDALKEDLAYLDSIREELLKSIEKEKVQDSDLDFSQTLLKTISQSKKPVRLTLDPEKLKMYFNESHISSNLHVRSRRDAVPIRSQSFLGGNPFRYTKRAFDADQSAFNTFDSTLMSGGSNRKDYNSKILYSDPLPEDLLDSYRQKTQHDNYSKGYFKNIEQTNSTYHTEGEPITVYITTEDFQCGDDCANTPNVEDFSSRSHGLISPTDSPVHTFVLRQGQSLHDLLNEIFKKLIENDKNSKLRNSNYTTPGEEARTNLSAEDGSEKIQEYNSTVNVTTTEYDGSKGYISVTPFPDSGLSKLLSASKELDIERFSKIPETRLKDKNFIHISTVIENTNKKEKNLGALDAVPPFTGETVTSDSTVDEISRNLLKTIPDPKPSDVMDAVNRIVFSQINQTFHKRNNITTSPELSKSKADVRSPILSGFRYTTRRPTVDEPMSTPASTSTTKESTLSESLINDNKYSEKSGHSALSIQEDKDKIDRNNTLAKGFNNTEDSSSALESSSLGHLSNIAEVKIRKPVITQEEFMKIYSGLFLTTTTTSPINRTLHPELFELFPVMTRPMHRVNDTIRNSTKINNGLVTSLLSDESPSDLTSTTVGSESDKKITISISTTEANSLSTDKGYAVTPESKLLFHDPDFEFHTPEPLIKDPSIVFYKPDRVSSFPLNAVTAVNASIKMHLFENRTLVNRTAECSSPSYRRCHMSGECVPSSVFCNLIPDCEDESDESNCSCADYLRAQHLHRKICDEVIDCWDQSDESQCEWCSPGYHICAGSRQCVSPRSVCDGVVDCPRGDDEMNCVTIAPNEDAATDLNYYDEGYLMVRRKGRWGKLCIDNFDDVFGRSGKGGSLTRSIPLGNRKHAGAEGEDFGSGANLNSVDSLGDSVCKSLSYDSLEHAERLQDPQRILSSRTATHEFDPVMYFEIGVGNTHISSRMRRSHQEVDLNWGGASPITSDEPIHILAPDGSRASKSVVGTRRTKEENEKDSESTDSGRKKSLAMILSSAGFEFRISDVVDNDAVEEETTTEDRLVKRSTSSMLLSGTGDHVTEFQHGIEREVFVTVDGRTAAIGDQLHLSNSHTHDSMSYGQKIKHSQVRYGGSLYSDAGTTRSPFRYTTKQSLGDVSSTTESTLSSATSATGGPKLLYAENSPDHYAYLYDKANSKPTTNVYQLYQLSHKEKLNTHQGLGKPQLATTSVPSNSFQKHTLKPFRISTKLLIKNEDVSSSSDDSPESDAQVGVHNTTDDKTFLHKISSTDQNQSMDFPTNSGGDGQTLHLAVDSGTSKQALDLSTEQTSQGPGHQVLPLDMSLSLDFKQTTCPRKDVVKLSCGNLQCGVRPQALGKRARIVGGSSSSPGAWPWQAALYKEGEYQCGASLITRDWLVSAGHCFYGSEEQHWVARLGALRRGASVSSPYEQRRTVSHVFIHPDYIDASYTNDVSLLKLERAVVFTDFVRPVCLPTPDYEIKTGRQCTLIGWGQLFEVGKIFPDSLQEVEVPLISTAECQRRTLFLPLYRVTQRMFCAGYVRGGRDACLGDSGGPLVCQEPDGQWVLAGITSNGYGCARPNRPGVYTKVAAFRGWIHQVVSLAHQKGVVPLSPSPCPGFRCPLGACVAPSAICDGRADCEDGSDEAGCRRRGRQGR